MIGLTALKKEIVFSSYGPLYYQQVKVPQGQINALLPELKYYKKL